MMYHFFEASRACDQPVFDRGVMAPDANALVSIKICPNISDKRRSVRSGGSEAHRLALTAVWMMVGHPTDAIAKTMLQRCRACNRFWRFP